MRGDPVQSGRSEGTLDGNTRDGRAATINTASPPAAPPRTHAPDAQPHRGEVPEIAGRGSVGTQRERHEGRGRGSEGHEDHHQRRDIGLRCHDDASRRIPPRPVDYRPVVENSLTRTMTSVPVT